ncbi:MAG: FMN-binding protein [Candidatus Muiribacteriaceae bacterium]
MTNIIKSGLILMIFCVVAAGSLAFVNEKTKPVIAEYSALAEKNARQSLFVGDELDLTLFPDGTYEVKVKKRGHELTVMSILFREDTVRINYSQKEYPAITPSVGKEIADKINIDQYIDLDKVPEKYVSFYSSIMKAFSEKISFRKKTVVLDIFDLPSLTVNDLKTEFKGSTVKFSSPEDGYVSIDKVDDDFYKALKGEGKILFDNGDSVELPDKNMFRIFEYDMVYAGENFLGYVFKVSPAGYSSDLETIVGLDKNTDVIGINIVSQKETPGLGAKCQEDWFRNQFSGKSVEELYLKNQSKDGKIDSITAATITSQAVTSGVRKGLRKFISVIKGEVR